MPPKRKYDRKLIINTALDIVQKEGIESINARRLAKELNSSVQPIFSIFNSMSELKDELYNRMIEKFTEYMNSSFGKEKEYRQTGLSYIKFANDYKEYFKALMMQKTDFNIEEFINSNEFADDIIKAGQKLTNFSYEEQKKFHTKVFILTHGIATLVATNTVKFSDDEIESLLGETVNEMLNGYKRREK